MNKSYNFDLKQIRSFLEITRESSFTKASRRLKIGQATISHHIQSLERSLGVSLFQRTAKDVSLSEEGKVFRDFCDRILNDADRMRAELKGTPQSAPVRVVASTIPSAYILPSAIAETRRKFGECVFRIEVADSREAFGILKEGRVDLAVLGNRFSHPSFAFKRLHRDEIVLIGPAGYPDAISIDQIRTLPLIIRESGSGTKKSCDDALIRKGIMPSELKVVHECSTSEALRESVKAGIGAAFISSLAVRSHLDSGKMKIITVMDFRVFRDFHVAFRKKKKLPPHVLFLLDRLIVE